MLIQLNAEKIHSISLVIQSDADILSQVSDRQQIARDVMDLIAEIERSIEYVTHKTIIIASSQNS